jgi:hypothetical protein
MRLAHWVSCEDPTDDIRKGMVHLCELVTCNEDEIEGTIDIYIHHAQGLAFTVRNWRWSVANILS